MPNFKSNLIGGVVGNILEWYDFAVYGFFAPVIASQFFPSSTRLVSLLGAFGVFAGAYLMRPFGGLLFGHIGDRLGRKSALQLSVLLMALPTTLIGFLPTYASIGGWAAFLLVVLRLLQGLSVGGELVGSISFITEIAPPSQRGLYGSWALCSSTAGVMLGSLVALGIQEGLGPARAEAWGWRLPFLAGLLVGGFGLWMREGMSESPEFEEMKRSAPVEENPVGQVLRQMPDRIAVVAFLVALTGGGFYMLFVWWPTLLTQMIHPPIPHALLVNTLAMLTLMIAIPGAGWLSDQVGRKPVIMTGAVGVAVAAYPLFSLVDHGTFASALGAQMVFAVLMSGATGPIPATMVELFPTRTRFSGVAAGYNISLALLGGTAPLISTWLVGYSGSVITPAYYLIFLAVLTLGASWSLPPPYELNVEGRPPAHKRRPLVFPLPPSSTGAASRAEDSVKASSSEPC